LQRITQELDSKKELSAKYAMHLALSERLVKVVKERSLDALSDYEERIMSDCVDSQTIENILKYVQSPQSDENDLMRLLLILFNSCKDDKFAL